MGFFKSCWEALLQFTAYAGVDRYGSIQQPLPLPPDHGVTVIPHQASPGFVCSYPTLKGWESCNTPDDRSCWIRDPNARQPLWSQFDITTNYEDTKKGTAPGIKREYWLEVEGKPLTPDGYLKPLGQVFNGSYPGPLIEACWGDELFIHVTNKLATNGTTVHWHGIRQLGSNEMDGVNGVTQCPIAQNETFTYHFKLHQYGHTWYHSHYSLQYPDGVAGPFLIHGPSSANWDEAWDPVLINDWVHNSSFFVFPTQELNGTIPLAASIVFNGTGHYMCNATDSFCCSGNNPDPRCGCNPRSKTGNCGSFGTYFEKTFVAGKRYLLRLINASAESMFIFSIDGHEMEVIQTDLVPIKPYNTSSLFLGIGQRYQVIVTAKPSALSPDGNYWIRTRMATGCGNIEQDNETTGIIRYNPQSRSKPTTSAQHNRIACADEPAESLSPIVEWNVDTMPENTNVDDYTFEAGFGKNKSHGFIRWELTNTPLWLDFSNPTILNLENRTFNPEYAVVEYDYHNPNGYVYLVITGRPDFPAFRTAIPAAHPIHLHGHDFVILKQTNASEDAGDPSTWNFRNPPRRDVALLASNGTLALAFKPDNPGVWLVHCHIAWHASSGLALQIMERQDDILGSIGTLTNTVRTCEGWDKWDLAFEQDDSGV